MTKTVTIQLKTPTVFYDLNVANKRPKDELSTQLSIKWPTFQTLHDIAPLSDNERLHYCARELAGLSDDDFEELSSADLTEIFRVFVKALMQFEQACKDYQSKLKEKIATMDKSAKE